jgi:hypothetical protein
VENSEAKKEFVEHDYEVLVFSENNKIIIRPIMVDAIVESDLQSFVTNYIICYLEPVLKRNGINIILRIPLYVW